MTQTTEKEFVVHSSVKHITFCDINQNISSFSDTSLFFPNGKTFYLFADNIQFASLEFLLSIKCKIYTEPYKQK